MSLWRAYLAELVGTFALVFVGAGAVIMDAYTGGVACSASHSHTAWCCRSWSQPPSTWAGPFLGGSLAALLYSRWLLPVEVEGSPAEP